MNKSDQKPIDGLSKVGILVGLGGLHNLAHGSSKSRRKTLMAMILPGALEPE